VRLLRAGGVGAPPLPRRRRVDHMGHARAWLQAIGLSSAAGVSSERKRKRKG
jgi:hypothetical protein